MVGAGVGLSSMADIGEVISQVINIFGLVIIAWGVARAAKEWLYDEYRITFHHRHPTKLMHVRRNLAIYLLLGLEFIVAADIIHTMLHLDMQKLMILGGLIVIRIVVGYMLDKEIKDYEELTHQQIEEGDEEWLDVNEM